MPFFSPSSCCLLQLSSWVRDIESPLALQNHSVPGKSYCIFSEITWVGSYVESGYQRNPVGLLQACILLDDQLE